MQPEPTPPASMSTSSSSSLAVPIPGAYLIHGLPMQIMEKRQRSIPRPRSPLRSQVSLANDDDEQQQQKPEVDNKQLEEPVVLAASVPPCSVAPPTTAGIKTTARRVTAPFDPFAAYDPECFEDLGLEDAEFSFDIRIIEEADETTMATAGGAVERAECLSGSAAPLSGPGSVPSTVPASVPASTLASGSKGRPVIKTTPGDTNAHRRPSLTRTDDAQLPTSDAAPIPETTTIPASTSVPVGLGLLAPEAVNDVNEVGIPSTNAAPINVLGGDQHDGAQGEPAMQLMTLESSSSISCLAAPMVPPSLSAAGPSHDVGGRTAGGGMMPPSLSQSGGGGGGVPDASGGNVSTSSGSLKEPPVQEMCVPTAVMPGPSPSLAHTTPPIRVPEAVPVVAEPSPPAEADGPGVDVDERYVGNRLLKSVAAIERWRHACADADSPGTSRERPNESAHPAVERRDDLAHTDRRDEPVGRRGDVSLIQAHAVTEANTATATTTDASFDIVGPTSTHSSALKAKKSVEGLGLGLPSEVPGIVVTRAASVSVPSLGPDSEDRPMMSTAPGCMDLAALARGDTDLDPTLDVRSPIMMPSEVRDGTRFFTRAPLYPKRLLWSVEEEDQEDLALFEFDEEEELRKLDERVRELQAQREREAGGVPCIPIPRLALGAGVNAGARALGGAWSRISSLVLSSPAGTSQYDADVEEGGDIQSAPTTVNTSCRASYASDASSSRGCFSEEQQPLVDPQTCAALDDVPLSSTSVPTPASAARKGYVSSFMSRISLSRSSSATSSLGPVSAMPTSPTGRKSPGFVEHADVPRGLGLGRLGAAAVKRFQMLF